MDELNDALDKLLNDPGTMAQVMSLAKNLGAAAGPPQEPSAASAPSDRHTALFHALGPYLSPKRRQKLEKAMQLARLSTLAGAAMHGSDGETEKGW